MYFISYSLKEKKKGQIQSAGRFFRASNTGLKKSWKRKEKIRAEDAKRAAPLSLPTVSFIFPATLDPLDLPSAPFILSRL